MPMKKASSTIPLQDDNNKIYAFFLTGFIIIISICDIGLFIQFPNSNSKIVMIIRLILAVVLIPIIAILLLSLKKILDQIKKEKELKQNARN